MGRHAAKNAPLAPSAVRLPHRPANLRCARNPYQVMIQFSLVTSGISLGIFGPAAESVASDFPTAVQMSIGIFAAVGAAITLIGICLSDEIASAFVEMAGQLGILGPVALYAIDIIGEIKDFHSGFGAMALIFTLGAVIWRLEQIIIWIRWRVRETKKEYSLSEYINSVGHKHE